MIKTTNDLRKFYPKLVAEVEREAVTGERVRLAALDNMSGKGDNGELNVLIGEAKKLGVAAEIVQPVAERIKAVGTMAQIINNHNRQSAPQEGQSIPNRDQQSAAQAMAEIINNNHGRRSQ